MTKVADRSEPALVEVPPQKSSGTLAAETRLALYAFPDGGLTPPENENVDKNNRDERDAKKPHHTGCKHSDLLVNQEENYFAVNFVPA